MRSVLIVPPWLVLVAGLAMVVLLFALPTAGAALALGLSGAIFMAIGCIGWVAAYAKREIR